ncbi:ribonuclease HI [Sinorhizobium sp. A49]|uniref:ribonuclease HI n=1 Tax=Sinorhizobium sp. A49 TaxID=1945861 RepID=UPI0009868285|nr:ribonuclease HI [Sinorhizobium sp. A49]OOG68189.1 ribonuclease HI [Sinorhizobium sp. A49]
MTTEILNSNNDSRRYIISTDGACRINPGPGGWGVVLQLEVCGQITKERELSGATIEETTNNRMELSAVLGVLGRLMEKTIPITVRSDSRYVIDGMSRWLEGWKQNGWRTSDKKPVKNKDLWLELDQLCGELGPISWEWVRGHSGDALNERCDRLANLAIDTALRGISPISNT